MSRVLHVITGISPISGGPSFALQGLTEAQVRAGAQVAVVGLYTGDEIPPQQEQMRRSGVEVTLLGPVDGRYCRHPATRATIRQAAASADLLHIHAIWEHIQHQAVVVARELGKPYIFRPCGMLDPWSLRQGWLKKQLYLMWRLRRDLNAAAALHYTAELERDLAAPLGLHPPSLVVPNGVDLREFESLPERGFLRQRFGQIGNRRILLFLSRIHPKKGLDLLVNAFAQARRDGWVLVITGPDAAGHEAEIRGLVKSLGIDESVIFTGPIFGADRVAALRDAELFVLPSHQENFGIAVVEALAAGVPVLISDQVNIHREITAARVGGVVSLDTAELAREMDRWMSDENLRTQSAARSRPFARENYDWSKIALRWMDEYCRLIKAR